MNLILVLITLKVFFNISNAEELWQRLDQPRVDASFWDLFQVDGKTYTRLNDGLFVYTGEEYIYVDDPFFQDKGTIYSLRVENCKGVMSSEAGIYYLEDNKWNKCEEISNEMELENITFLGNKIVGNYGIYSSILYSNNDGRTWNFITNGIDTLKASEMYLFGDTIHSTFFYRYLRIYEEGDSLTIRLRC
jgi:hypothetical protein